VGTSVSPSFFLVAKENNVTPILPDLLVMDHRRIKSLYTELQQETEKDGVSNEDACFNLFRTLKALITSHAKAEEYTLYALFDIGKKPRHEELQHFALEGYEEHDLIDKILKEMGQAEEVSPQWRAQLTVLTELLERHIEEEEQEFFPQVRTVIGHEELLDLGAIYLRERDEIFTKKSGMNFHTTAMIKNASLTTKGPAFQTRH
jgi:hemerythrin-like domain-containing protein